MLYLNLITYIAVIWPTFLLLADSSELSMLDDEMNAKLKDCQFLPNNFARQFCHYLKPEKKNITVAIFDNQPHLCMELLSVSSQLCDPKWRNQIPLRDELKKLPIIKPEEFCNQLVSSKTPSIETFFSKRQIDILQNEKNCKRVCIYNGAVNRICEEILLSYKLLAETHSGKPAQVETISSSDVAQSPSAPISEHEQNTGRDNLTKSDAVSVRNPAANDLQRKSEDEPQGSIPSGRASVDRESVATNPKKELTPESGSNHETQKTVQDQDQYVSSTGIQKDQHQQVENQNIEGKVPPDSPSSSVLTSSPQSSVVNSTKAESTGNVMANAPEGQHEESNTENLKSIGVGDGMTNDEQIPLTDDDNGDMESKVANIEDSPSSDSRDDPYDGGADEPQNAASNIEQPNETIVLNRGVDSQDSHFFAYFLTMVVICIIGYLVFHNKQKIIALALEGRRMQGSRRRPNTSSYKKLDSNLEEAVTSSCSSSSVTHVIF